jgi:hypothetical protein
VLDADGLQFHTGCPEFPLLLQAETHLRLVLAPITDDRRHVHWRLLADIECEGTRNSVSWDAQVTAETGFKVAHPGGGSPEFVPVHVIARHWNLKYPFGIVSASRDDAVPAWQADGPDGLLFAHIHNLQMDTCPIQIER